MKLLQSINPFDQTLLAEHTLMTDGEINLVLENAESSFRSWKTSRFKERGNLLKQLANTLRANKEKYAFTISTEMGKILKESRAEIEKCATCCEFYAERGEEFLKDEEIKTDAKKSLVAFDPIGAVFAIMPWNFPFWQVIRFAAPTIMGGNVALLKHAKNVTQCSKMLEESFIEAGFPKNIFQSLIIESSQAEKIIEHNIVQGITLTGSEYAGSSVASLAGKHIKKTVMELGGSDPFIILDDADILLAAKIATQSRMLNAGQSCIAAKRFIVIEQIKDEFLNAFKNEVEKLKQGDQLDETTTVGPLSSLQSAVELEEQQNNSIKQNAEIIIGAKRSGANYQPTILSNIKKGMPAYNEEMFGPVASVITAKNDDDAIEIANDHRYGLGAAIFTKDLDKAYLLARKINSGAVFVNSMVKSDSRLPFGGVKKSGYGRELSYYGMREFMNIKTIYIDP